MFLFPINFRKMITKSSDPQINNIFASTRCRPGQVYGRKTYSFVTESLLFLTEKKVFLFKLEVYCHGIKMFISWLCVWMMCIEYVPFCTCKSATSLWSVFFPSIFKWILESKLRSCGLHGALVIMNSEHHTAGWRNLSWVVVTMSLRDCLPC